MAESVKGVILDWAGTSVDHGCFGPVAVFREAFEHFGVSPSDEEIREPMGRAKREHVRLMLDGPRLGSLWRDIYGRDPTEEDVDEVFAKFVEITPRVLADYGKPVPACAETMARLREKGIKIGSCTGYSRSMMTELIPAAREAGFAPDCLVTADEVPKGRPMPWMCWLNCMRLGLFPPETVVKVGDTEADIREGVNAGHWSVGVLRSSNALGYTEDALAAADPAELARREEELARKFRAAGAHYVLRELAELPELCDEISQAMAAGRRP